MSHGVQTPARSKAESECKSVPVGSERATADPPTTNRKKANKTIREKRREALECESKRPREGKRKRAGKPEEHSSAVVRYTKPSENEPARRVIILPPLFPRILK